MHYITKNIAFEIFDKQNRFLNGIYFDQKNQLANQNITYLQEYFNCQNIIIPQQIHSSNVISINKDSSSISLKEKIICDALVTNCKNITLCIQTADCVPVLLFCKKSNVIGAAHCGWKGAKNDILKNTILSMKQYGAKNIQAIIGPAIQQKSYNVKQDFYNHFIAESNDFERFFKYIDNENFLFNLPEFVKYKLKKEGVAIHLHINKDTYALPTQYYSYRYNTHNKINSKARILTCISLS